MGAFSKMPPGSFTPQAGSIQWVSEGRKDSPQMPAEAAYKGVGLGRKKEAMEGPAVGVFSLLAPGNNQSTYCFTGSCL